MIAGCGVVLGMLGKILPNEVVSAQQLIEKKQKEKGLFVSSSNKSRRADGGPSRCGVVPCARGLAPCVHALPLQLRCAQPCPRSITVPSLVLTPYEYDGCGMEQNTGCGERKEKAVGSRKCCNKPSASVQG